MKIRKLKSYFAHSPMNKCKVILMLANLFIGTKAYTQSLTPQVIATAGGYQTSAAGSLSFTIGETNTQTLSSATHMLTQGFQQPYKLSLNVKAFLQGYYVGSGMMANVLNNQGVTTNPGNETDSITIELREAASPFNLISTTKQIIQINGTVSYQGLATAGQSCYIVIKHRNSIETWSANPVLLTENTIYDFSTAANKAYGDNQKEVEPGMFAFFSGDINQDGYIDGFDYPDFDNDSQNNVSGAYATTDLNGDGYVDGFDYPLFDENSQNNVSLITP